MVIDVYKKIEKKITSLKNREEMWRNGYKEATQQLKELVDSNSQQIKEIDKTIGTFKSRLDEIEKLIKKNDEKTMDTFRRAEKRVFDIMEKAKSLSVKISKIDERTMAEKADMQKVEALINRRMKEVQKSSHEQESRLKSEIISMKKKAEEAVDSRFGKMKARVDAGQKRQIELLESRLKSLSGDFEGKINERDSEISGLKSELSSQVNSIKARHEKTFGDAVEKINLAVKSIENGALKESNISDKADAAKRFLGNNRPSDQPSAQGLPAPPVPVPQHARASMASAPEIPVPRPPYAYNPVEPPYAPAILTEGASRRLPVSRIPKRPVFLDDDDLDMDDIDPMDGQGMDFTDSVAIMNTHVSAITDKLASIEEKVARIRSERGSSADRIEDKIKMYSQSVADIHNRMETVEKALRNGMTPMVESLNILTQTVKSLKEDTKPSIPRPSLPLALKESRRAREKAPAGAFKAGDALKGNPPSN